MQKQSGTQPPKRSKSENVLASGGLTEQVVTGMLSAAVVIQESSPEPVRSPSFLYLHDISFSLLMFIGLHTPSVGAGKLVVSPF
jgi:hypothetical protein